MTKRTTRWLLCLVLVVALVASLSLVACDKTATATFVGGDGATGNAPEPITANVGEKIHLPSNTFTYANHNFAGWSDGTTVYQAGAEYTLVADVTFTAQWTQAGSDATKYSLKYELGDHAAEGATVPETQQLAKGATYTLPDGPDAADGWEFNGWSDGTTVYQAGATYTMPASEKTLTAQWKQTAKQLGFFNAFAPFELSPDTDVISQICISSEDFGAIYPVWAGMASITLTYDYEQGLAEILPYKVVNGAIEVYEEDGSTKAEGVSIVLQEGEGNYILNVSINRTLEYEDYDNWGPSGPAIVTKEIKVNVSLQLYELEITGCKAYNGTYLVAKDSKLSDIFEAFTFETPTEMIFNGEPAEDTAVMPAKKSTLELKGLYTITFVLGEGHHAAEDATLPAMEVYEAGTITIYDDVEAATGWEFVGWEDEDGTVVELYGNYNMPQHDVVFTAKWQKAAPPKYRFELTLGIWANASDQEDPSMFGYGNEYEEGEEITLPSVKTADDGWKFTCWKDVSTETTYNAGETFKMPAHAVELTAQYEEVPEDDFTGSLFDGWIEIPDTNGTRVLGLAFSDNGKVLTYALNNAQIEYSGEYTYTVANKWVEITLGTDTLSLQILGANLSGGGTITVGGQKVTVQSFSALMRKLTIDSGEGDPATMFAAMGSNPLVPLDLGSDKHVEIDGEDVGSWKDWTMPGKNTTIKIVDPQAAPTLDSYQGEWYCQGTIEAGPAEYDAFKVVDDTIIMREYEGNFLPGDAVTPELSLENGKVVARFESGIFTITITFESETSASVSVTDSSDWEIDSGTFTKQGGAVQTHTVTLKTDGSTVWKTVQVEHGKTLELDETPTDPEGTRTFYSWNTELGDVFNLQTPITEDITLEALFRVRVDYNLDGGEGELPEAVWATSSRGSVSVTLPSADGYSKGEEVLVGWNDGTSTYNPGTEQTFSKSVTLKAVWGTVDPNPDYTVTYEKGLYAATGDVPPQEKHKAGEQFNLPDNPFACEGKVFDGWLVGSESEPKAPGTSVTMPAGDLTIKGKWSDAVITVKYDPNGGSGTMATQTTVYNNKLVGWAVQCTLTAPEGKMFAGWSLTTTGAILTGQDGDTAWSAIKTYVKHEGDSYTITLYAIWEAEHEEEVSFADICGVWKSGNKEIVISEAGASGSDVVGSAIEDGQCFHPLTLDVTNNYIDKVNNDNFRIVVTSADSISIDGTVFSKTAELKDVAAEDLVGKWNADSGTSYFTISALGVVTYNINSQNNPATLYRIDKYVVIAYELLSAKTTFILTLNEGKDQLTGYSATGDDRPVARSFQKDASASEDSNLLKYVGEVQYTYTPQFSSTSYQIGFKSVTLIDGDDTQATVTFSIDGQEYTDTFSKTDNRNSTGTFVTQDLSTWKGSTAVAVWWKLYPFVNKSVQPYKTTTAFSVGRTEDKSKLSFVVSGNTIGEMTLENPELAQPVDPVEGTKYEGNVSFASKSLVSSSFVFTEIVVANKNGAVELTLTYTVDGGDKITETVTATTEDVSHYSGSGTCVNLYSFTLQQTGKGNLALYLAELESGALELCDTSGNLYSGQFTRVEA